MEADHFRDDHRDGLAEHRRLRLDPADAPAEHAEAVDHRGVAVGADQGVGIGHFPRSAAPVLARAAVALALILCDWDVLLAPVLGAAVAADFGRRPDTSGDIFEVHLVADAGAGRDDLEIAERLLAPFEEAVALHVALIFEDDVLLERGRRAEGVDHHAVIDDEVDGHERVDLLRVAAEARHRVAHRGEIDHRRHPGEILHQHARRAVLDLARRGAGDLPVDQRLDVLDGDRDPVLEAQQIFEQHLQREGQLVHIAELFGGLGQRVISVGCAAHIEAGAGAERVLAGRCHGASSSRWLAAL